MNFPHSGVGAIDDLLKINPAEITTMVDDGVEIEGAIRVRSGRAIMITGSIKGSIDSNGPVIINKGLACQR